MGIAPFKYNQPSFNWVAFFVPKTKLWKHHR